MRSASELEHHRVALTGHCYRMLGSAVDADDAVQETMVRAWKALERFDARSSLKTWLYRIATNVCLDTLGDTRRVRPIEDGPPGAADDVLDTRPQTHWLEPIADARAIPADADPAEAALLRESIRLAFVAALQHLPPKQRAALLLTEVLGWSVAEVAAALETSIASINSALQRARATLAARQVGLEAPREAKAVDLALVERYVDAFQRYDIDALAALLRDDAIMSMPPYTLWLQGPDSIRSFMLGRGAGCRGSRLVAAPACGQPAFGQYKLGDDGVHRAWGLVVLEVAGDHIASLTTFLDTERIFPRFGLPLELR
jgi:RNA polymerase sigma-70 factor, ECF subfamily